MLFSYVCNARIGGRGLTGQVEVGVDHQNFGGGITNSQVYINLHFKCEQKSHKSEFRIV